MLHQFLVRDRINVLAAHPLEHIAKQSEQSVGIGSVGVLGERRTAERSEKMLRDHIGHRTDCHTSKEGRAQQECDGEAPRTIVHAHTSVQPPVVTGLLRLLTGEAPFASLDWVSKQSNDPGQSYLHLRPVLVDPDQCTGRRPCANVARNCPPQLRGPPSMNKGFGTCSRARPSYSLSPLPPLWRNRSQLPNPAGDHGWTLARDTRRCR